jgi:hypothetical protein
MPGYGRCRTPGSNGAARRSCCRTRRCTRSRGPSRWCWRLKMFFGPIRPRLISYAASPSFGALGFLRYRKIRPDALRTEQLAELPLSSRVLLFSGSDRLTCARMGPRAALVLRPRPATADTRLSLRSLPRPICGFSAHRAPDGALL